MKLPAMRTAISTAPAVEPVTVAETKQHLRIDHSDEDAHIGVLIQVARQHCEDVSRRSFVTRTYTGYLDCWPWDGWIELPYPPLIGVTSITYFDEADAPTVFAAANYLVDNTRQPGRIVLRSNQAWPGDVLRVANGVQVIWTAGYGAAAAATPARYRAAILLMVGHLYENREAVLAGQGVSQAALPLGVDALLLTDRGMW